LIPIPNSCPRGCDDCVALARIESDGGVSFFCVGENDGHNRPVEQDRYTVCYKGPYRDDKHYYDKRDLIHHASVMMQAVAVVERDVASEKKDWSPWDPDRKRLPTE